MNLLLDTCALLALADGSLQSAGFAALTSCRRAVVSPVVTWEIAIKVKSGKLTIPLPPREYAEALARRHNLVLAPGLDSALLCAAADLPLIHRDPFDRVLVASALRENLILLTSDRIMPSYPGVIALW